MIYTLFALALQAAGPSTMIDSGSLGAIGTQALPAKGCAAYLWNVSGTRVLVAMAGADPAQLRIAVDGKTKDYARTAQSGAGGFGFAAVTEYRGGDVTATLDMTITTRGDLAQGATVMPASLRIDRPGHDTIIVPVGGMIGCV
ncbi:hypothetical protein U1701_12285 [Sphingomonas sp. PB2P19]|uniref:hypothetical protein n=1 Tax=Sphingomonas rhamnosi TaxID=3096156 RepID=UPI002FCC5343